MKIAVDPGHGMSNKSSGIYDPGATAKGFQEASVALDYGLCLQGLLTGKGHDVFMTRASKTDSAPVVARAAHAEAFGADVFISLHLNAFNNSASGVEVLYRSPGSAALAQKLQTALVNLTGFNDRAIKVREDLAVLKFGGVAVLIELGFIDSDSDRAKLLDANVRQAICDTIAATAVS